MYGSYAKNPQDKRNKFYRLSKKEKNINKKFIAYGCLGLTGVYAIVGLIGVLISFR